MDNSNNDGSMMSSGDSPDARHHEIFDFKEAGQSGGRSSPLPTTSKEVGVQSTSATGGGVVQASVLVEPGKDGDDKEELCASPTLNSSEDRSVKQDDAEQTMAMDDLNDKGDKKENRKKMNGDLDKLDGVWVPGGEKKSPSEDGEEDNCVVKCLYVTMTCCECSIM